MVPHGPDPAPWRGVWLKQEAPLTVAGTPSGACKSWWIKDKTGPECPTLGSGGTKGLLRLLSTSSRLPAVITAVEFLNPGRALF